jgi:hypothetical protein
MERKEWNLQWESPAENQWHGYAYLRPGAMREQYGTTWECLAPTLHLFSYFLHHTVSPYHVIIFSSYLYLQQDLKVWRWHTICTFSPEDGDSMFLRNVGIYLRVHTASQHRITRQSGFRSVLKYAYMHCTATSFSNKTLSQVHCKWFSDHCQMFSGTNSVLIMCRH